MSDRAPVRLGLRVRISTTLEATLLVLRALLRHRMGPVLPLAVMLMLIAYIGMVLGFVGPLSLLSGGAQVTPFIYPLF
jgi:hypothetical protein